MHFFCLLFNRPEISARRTQCRNNLKQLGLAVHNFQQTYLKVPPGYIGPNPVAAYPGTGTNSYVGSLVHLPPYIEQSQLFNKFDPALLNATNSSPNVWWGDSNAWAAANTRITAFMCPSTNTYADVTLGVCAFLNYFPGTFEAQYFGSSGTIGRTNYVSCAGYFGTTPGNDTYKGLFGNRTKFDFRDVTDGTSNSLMIGETQGGREANGSFQGTGDVVGRSGQPGNGVGTCPQSPDRLAGINTTVHMLVS